MPDREPRPDGADPLDDHAIEEDDPTPLEESAGEQLGVDAWDRPLIFRETAEAAIDNDLPYWAVLVLSGAIATLGLATGSSAVVIGAMLVAPLLAPIMGASLALAVGDGRLAIQVGAVVAASALAVIATAALLTLALPFQTITTEISSRIEPTTLDLGIAVFSGLVGAVVVVARGSRLSAAIPGVAVAVALIPPLAVTGFGMGAGWQTDIIVGSLLLFGANLAGIVLSGTALFLLVGMHRRPVIRAARDWHQDEKPVGVAGWASRARWVARLGVIGSPRDRILLVAAFTAALAVPLTSTLRQVIREARVGRAIDGVQAWLEDDVETAVLGRELLLGEGDTRVWLRVATSKWIGEDRRTEFERRATQAAGEPVYLVLEQLAASSAAVESLERQGAGAARGLASRPARTMAGADDDGLPVLADRGRALLQAAALDLPFPEGAWPVAADLTVQADGVRRVEVVYLAEAPLGPGADAVLARALRRAVDDDAVEVRFRPLDPVVTTLRLSGSNGVGASGLAPLAEALRRYPALRLELAAGPDADGLLSASLDALEAAGVAPERVVIAPEATGPPGSVRARLGPPG